MKSQQKGLKVSSHGTAMNGSRRVSLLELPAWIYPAASMLLVLFLSTALFAQEDPIYEKCTAQTKAPAPWCYQEEVEKIGDPNLCENILKYWPKADGVHGWCYYRLALVQKDCELCNRIATPDIKRMCKLDACK